MKELFKWILTIIVFSIGWCGVGLFFYNDAPVGWKLFGLLLSSFLISNQAISSWKRYFDKLFEN